VSLGLSTVVLPAAIAGLVDRDHDLVVDEGGTRLARVLGLDVGELLGARLHRISDTEQRELALGGGGLAPGLEGVRSGLERGIHVGLTGDRR
jgi:hypothetical protein